MRSKVSPDERRDDSSHFGNRGSAAALALRGAGVRLFTPANQKIACAAVAPQDHGMPAAMPSSFGAAAGTTGAMIAVASMESGARRRLWTKPVALSCAQQFVFACLIPVGLIAIWIAFRSRPEFATTARVDLDARRWREASPSKRKGRVKPMVVDFQHHYIPVELAKKRGLYAETGRTMLQEGGLPATTMHRRLYDLELQLEDMQEAGVDVSVLSCLLGWSASLDECRFINDDLARIEKKYPRRFVGLAQAPILEGKAALDELRRALGDLGLHGVTITSQVHGLSLDSPKLYDFYETACALEATVFVHPALVPTGYEHLKDYDLPRVLGREVDLTVATTRLIAGGVFDRFPDLKIVMAHFGGGIAAVKDRLIAKGYRFGTLKHPFGEYYDLVYFDMAGFEGGLAPLRCALEGIRPERLVFASDYPQDFTGVNTDTGKGMAELRSYIGAVRGLPLDEATKDSMLGGTAARLLRL